LVFSFFIIVLWHDRHDLERLRNLSYLVSKREKLKRSYFELDRECFQKQVEYLNKYKANTGNQYHSEAPSLIQPLTGSLSHPPVSNNSHRTTNFRIRDILQFKNEKCIYDFPEKWTVGHESAKPVIAEEVDEPAKTTSFSSQNACKQIIKKYDNLLMTRKRKKSNRTWQVTDESEEESVTSSGMASSQKSAKTNIKDISINILNNSSSCSSMPMSELSSGAGEIQAKENRRQLRNENSKSSSESSQQTRRHTMRPSTVRLRQNETSLKKYNYRVTKFRLNHSYQRV
jgi:hypothetical protein